MLPHPDDALRQHHREVQRRQREREWARSSARAAEPRTGATGHPTDQGDR